MLWPHGAAGRPYTIGTVTEEKGQLPEQGSSQTAMRKTGKDCHKGQLLKGGCVSSSVGAGPVRWRASPPAVHPLWTGARPGPESPFSGLFCQRLVLTVRKHLVVQERAFTGF